MAVTATRVKQGPGANLPFVTVGNGKKTVTSVLMDSSYTSGGEALTAADLGFAGPVTHANVVGLSFDGVQSVNVASANYEVVAGGGKIHLWDETPAEVGSTNDVSGTTVLIEAFGPY